MEIEVLLSCLGSSLIYIYERERERERENAYRKTRWCYTKKCWLLLCTISIWKVLLSCHLHGINGTIFHVLSFYKITLSREPSMATRIRIYQGTKFCCHLTPDSTSLGNFLNSMSSSMI